MNRIFSRIFDFAKAVLSYHNEVTSALSPKATLSLDKTSGQCCRKRLLLRVYTKLMTYAREQDLKCSLRNSFVVSFVHLKLRREHKENYTRVGESKARTG